MACVGEEINYTFAVVSDLLPDHLTVGWQALNLLV